MSSKLIGSKTVGGGGARGCCEPDGVKMATVALARSKALCCARVIASAGVVAGTHICVHIMMNAYGVSGDRSQHFHAHLDDKGHGVVRDSEARTGHCMIQATSALVEVDLANASAVGVVAHGAPIADAAQGDPQLQWVRARHVVLETELPRPSRVGQRKVQHFFLDRLVVERLLVPPKQRLPCRSPDAMLVGA